LPPDETEKLVGLTVKTLRLLDMLEILSTALPVLETVSVFWLLEPTVMLPKESEEVDNEMAATPAPVYAMDGVKYTVLSVSSSSLTWDRSSKSAPT
jgi:hypothetical protein